VEFPKDGDDQLKEAFRILNAWARRLEEWEIRVRAMCGILETREKLTRGEYARVAASIERGDHSQPEIRLALSGVVPASDIAGHPPGEPFSEPIT